MNRFQITSYYMKKSETWQICEFLYQQLLAKECNCLQEIIENAFRNNPRHNPSLWMIGKSYNHFVPKIVLRLCFCLKRQGVM